MNTAAMSTQPHVNHRRREIAAHFAGQGSPAGDAAMRAHFPTCASCRHHYDRHLTLARLDPRGLSAEQRIANGLGLRFPVSGTRSWNPGRLIAGILIPVASAAVFLVFARGHHDRPHSVDADAAYAARGTQSSEAHAPSLWTYRLGADGTPILADRIIGASEELAFAYSNPSAQPYVMIFGVDEHRHVYWFHPAWPTGQPAPVAIGATPGPGPHELPDAIRHAIDGHRLNVYAIFSDSAIAATTIEARVRAATGEGPLPSPGNRVVTIRHVFEVRP